MAKSKGRNKKSAAELMSTTWGLVVSAITLFGSGFAASQFINSRIHRLEIINKDKEYYDKIIEMREQYVKEIFDLKKENQILIIENKHLSIQTDSNERQK